MKPVALDLETYLIASGVLAPVPVCGSSADEGGQSVFGIDTTQATHGLPHTVRESELNIGANIAYDFGVMAAHALVPLEDIFKAYDEDRVYDVLIAQALDAIATGHLSQGQDKGLKDPRTGSSLKDPSGKYARRYSLEVCTDLTLGRSDAKKNDEYRLRYGLLAALPMSEWPSEAVQYPKDDVRNTFDVAMAQLGETARPEGAIWPGKEPHRPAPRGRCTSPPCGACVPIGSAWPRWRPRSRRSTRPTSPGLGGGSSATRHRRRLRRRTREVRTATP